jgi:glutamate--cysteine ligase
MRGADGGRWGRICALPALWVGLLYDDNALDAAWDRVKHWTIAEREALRHAVPKEALNALVPGGGTVRDLAREVLDIASAGLSARAMLNASGDNEGGFLDPLREVVASGMTPADRLLELYHGPWNGDVSRIYGEMSF